MLPHHDNHPSPWIAQYAPLAPPGGRVIDVACGSGRNGRLFLKAGHPTVFLDANTSGVADLTETETAEIRQHDLETKAESKDAFNWPFGAGEFAAVVATNYLWRPLLPALIDAVAPQGVFLYETFAVGNEAFGRPRNPDFLLQPGELLDIVRGRLRVIAYGQEIRTTPNTAVIQHIAAIRD